MIIPHYTHSNIKKVNKDIISAGISEDNVKIIKLTKNYKNPVFYPRKFEKWSDTFEVTLIDDVIKVRRTDQPTLGWGESLLIDVEFDLLEPTKQLSSQKIPRVIYQTFKTNDVPKGMYESINSWKNLNPEYEHYFYTDNECEDFIGKFFSSEVLNAYLDLVPGAFKADLFRCCVLYEKGGVYVDSDMICLKSLEEYIEHNDSFIVGRDDPMSKSFLYNAFMASEPKNPIFKQMIDNIVENVSNRRDLFYLDICGPGLLGKTVNKVCGFNENNNYELGVKELNGVRIKILKHNWETKTIKLGDVDLIYTEYPEKNREMIELKVPTYYSLYTDKIVYREIPRNIYHTSYDHLGVNQYMVDSFKNKNKRWNLQHYTDNDCLEFFKRYNDELKSLIGVDTLSYFLTLHNGGEKSDFWRYCVIYLFGGVYTDSDTYCNSPLDNWTVNHDLILGIEANLSLEVAETFGMDRIGYNHNGYVISVCNWTFAAKPKHEFFKKLILDICNNPINGDVLINTGPGRITKHTIEYFSNQDLSILNTDNIYQDKSVLFNINKFGSNQTHSNSYKSYDNSYMGNPNEVFVVHMFDGTWRSKSNQPIKTHKSNIGVSHNLTLLKTNTGYKGISRIDKDTSRTHFMKFIGDCRSLLEINYDFNFNIISEDEKHITVFNNIAKFEDYRWFTFQNKNYLCVSYIDEDFNTKVSVLNEEYKFLGDVKIDEYNRVSFNGPEKIWEKNWLFFEKDDELYFIYSTTPRYVVYKCINFESLEFEKDVNIEWPLNENVPNNEEYFTSYVGSPIKIATGGSSNPIYIESRGVYLYFIHTKFYSEKKYNHYAVILDKNMLPIKFCTRPIIHKQIPYDLFFVSSVIEVEDYLVFSGGISDNTNFIWELSKEHIFKIIGI
jgi:mannosyltransferase OCH1-like enzyme